MEFLSDFNCNTKYTDYQGLPQGRPFDYCLKGNGGDEREMKKAQRTEFTALVTGRGVEPLLPP